MQEERQSKPGAWALESQRLPSAKTGGAAGGDWGPTALSWGLGAKEGALWEEDDAEETALEGYSTIIDDEDNPVDEYQIFKAIFQSKFTCSV